MNREMTEKFIPTDGVPLTDYQREILTILQEEAAEVIVAASKILRFGLGNTNPTTGVTNTRELGLELGDLTHMRSLIHDAGLYDLWDEVAGVQRKCERLKRFMQTEK